MSDGCRVGYGSAVMRWNPLLVERWAFRAQLMAVGLLGLAVVMPFVLPAFVALVVTAVILGPRNLLTLARTRHRDDGGDGS